MNRRWTEQDSEYTVFRGKALNAFHKERTVGHVGMLMLLQNSAHVPKPRGIGWVLMEGNRSLEGHEHSHQQ